MSDEKREEKDCIKKRKSRIESEQQILDAALSVFSEQGYDAASIQTIAARANVNGALIIRYFGSKSGLLQAIILSGCKETFSTFRCGPAEEDLEAELLRFFMTEIELDFQHRDFIKVVFMRAAVDPEIGEVLEIIHKGERRDDLIRCLKPFQEKGEIAPQIDLHELSQIFNYFSLGLGSINFLIPNIERKHLEERAQLAAKIFAAGLKSMRRP